MGRIGKQLVLGLAIVIFVDAAYARRSGELSVQSLKNLNFVERADQFGLGHALELHPKIRPPLYPILLWACSRMGMAPRRVNQVLFYAILLLLAAWTCARLDSGLTPFLLVFYTVGSFNYVNMYQTTAEMLFGALSLASLLLLDAYGRAHTWGRLIALAAVCSALCVTRYFGLFFMLPLVAAHILLAGNDPLRRRLAQLAAFAAASLAPAAVWTWQSVAATGYLSGADRLEPRHLPERLGHWEQWTGPVATLVLWLKTLFVDFFSLHEYAALSVVTLPYRASPVECGVAVMTIAAVSLGVFVAMQDRSRAWLSHAGSLPLQFFGAYTVVTLVLWSVGNNDPLYTRFLYPSYLYLIVATFQAYELAKRNAPGWQRLPFRAAYVALLMVQGLRDLRAVALPYR